MRKLRKSQLFSHFSINLTFVWQILLLMKIYVTQAECFLLFGRIYVGAEFVSNPLTNEKPEIWYKPPPRSTSLEQPMSKWGT